jgi:hypothetical protein
MFFGAFTSAAEAASYWVLVWHEWNSCPSLSFPLYAALKRRSSTVLHGFVLAAGWVKIKVKSSGQECPLHTSKLVRR